jgi:two-component system phosphate regulon sensor histidine kinase PhoR
MSAWWIIPPLVLALAWALWSLRRANQMAKGLAGSLARGHAFLWERLEGLPGDRHWRRLSQAANRVLEEKKRLDNDRAGQGERLKATLTNMQEAVLIVDDADHVLLANEAFHRLFPGGRGGEEGIRRVLRNEALNEHLSAVREGEMPGRREVEFGSGGATSIWTEASGSRIPAFGVESAEATLLVLHDITRLRSLESVRKEFVANVSHELRTPLSLIKGYVETLADSDASLPEADRRRFLQIIEKHTTRLERLVEDLLALSRLESGNPRLRKEKIVLEGLMEEIVDTFRGHDSQSSGCQFSLSLEAEGSPVEADPLRIAQVLGNLLENAIKYSGGNARIEAGTRREGDVIRAWVHDSGVGISQHDLPHIFERFYRVDKGRSRESGGTGLGLSIVKHIIQLHGGRVWAESAPGKGTSIFFTLPLLPEKVGPVEVN